MKVKCLKFPAMILAIGLVAALAACLLSCISKRPVITEHDFRHSATYKLCGETKNIEGIYRCRYHLPEKKLASVERYYEGFFLTDPTEKMTGMHTIAQKDNLELCVVFIFADDYLMGDGDRGDVYSDVIPEPYLAVYDKEGYEYHDPQMLDQFDAQLLS